MAHDPQSVEQVFGDALDLPPEQRSAYLADACRDAPNLRRLVEELLAEDERAGSFMATPLLRPPSAASRHPVANGALSSQVTLTTAPPAYLPRFQPSQRIAGRFDVVRFLARGGMGEVYEVEDSLLQGTHVALKTILPEIAADQGGLHRFEQEVLLARKLVHPNLCPIYEIFRCEDPAPSFLFLTMKLLHGETLQARLRGNERISPEDAAKICHQLSAGLGAIHAAGIVHRDIKPNNVMLEHTGDKLRVSIMDFGLARLHESEATIIQAGTVAGTPGYLAPELLAGQRPTQATDLFALGVVLHQVFTGERPAETRHGRSVTSRPSLDNCGCAPELIRTVKDLLAEEPEQRCRAFEQIWVRTQGSFTPFPLTRAATGRKFTRRRFAFATGASVCALAGGALWEHQSIYNLLHPIPDKRFVAVLNWPPLTDERVRPMILGLIDAVADELARAEAFDHNFFVAAQKTASTMTTPAQLNEVRESLGANLVLATSAQTTGKDLRVSLHVLEPTTGRELRSKEVRAPLDQQLSLPQRVVRAAAELLDVEHYDPDDRRIHVGTDNPEALAAFQAAEAYRKQENDTGLEPAIEKYKQALELDPKYAVAQARLGWAYLRSYYLSRNAAALHLGRENCESALELDPDLVDGYVGLATAQEEMGDRTSAALVLSKALSLDPSNTHTLIYQANFDVDNGHYGSAEKTFLRVIKLRPNLWLGHNEYGVLLDKEGKYADALLEFRAASLAAPKNALNYSNIGSVLLQMGRMDESIENCKKSFALKENADAAVGLAAAYRSRGQLPEAIDFGKKAVALDPNWPPYWLDLGDSYTAARQSTAAREAYHHCALAEEAELQTEPKSGSGWMLLALCRAKTGEALGTVDSLVSKAEMYKAVDIVSQIWKARTLELLGRRADALTAVAHCFAIGATEFQIQSESDLEQLRRDPQYVRLRHSNTGPKQIAS